MSRFCDTAKGFHKNPDHHAQHDDAVHKASKHFHAPVTEGVHTIDALLSNTVSNERKE